MHGDGNTNHSQNLWVIHNGWSTKSIEELIGDKTMKEKQEKIVVLIVAFFNAFELGTKGILFS